MKLMNIWQSSSVNRLTTEPEAMTRTSPAIRGASFRRTTPTAPYMDSKVRGSRTVMSCPSSDAVHGLNSSVRTGSRTRRCVRYDRSAPGRKSIQHSDQNVSMLTGNTSRRETLA